MNRTARARQLRRDQTDEEKELWRAVKAGRFAGFKFRRQHPVGIYFLDCYCPMARLAVELDGFQHGLPEGIERDAEREKFLAEQDIEVLRFWNHQWNKNREGVLLEIWHALHRRTGCVKVLRKEQNHRFIPPAPGQLMGEPKPLPRQKTSSPQPSPPLGAGERENMGEHTSSPRPSPPSDGGEGEKARGLARMWGNGVTSPAHEA